MKALAAVTTLAFRVLFAKNIEKSEVTIMCNKITLTVELRDFALFDKLNNLAVEYTTTIDCLANLAVQRLLDDIEFYRKLRNISTAYPSLPTNPRPHPNEQK